MLVRPPLAPHKIQVSPPAFSEALRISRNSNPNHGSLACGAGSCGSSFNIVASLSKVTTEDRKPSSGSIQSGNGALLDQFLLHEDKLKDGSLSGGDSCSAKCSMFDLRWGGLDSILHSYSERFVIRCYEVGMNRTTSIETIANLLQEVACNHAQSVGFSTDGFATTPSMRKRRLIWVTTRMHIEVDEYPVWGDVVQIETWCQTEGKAGTRRDWLITNVTSGKQIGRVTSTWVMMNQDSRRLSRITDDVREEYAQYCPVPPRYAFPEENSSSLKKIPKLDDPAQHIRSGLMPRRGDLDMNQHVNNVTYIGWILESTPPEVLDTHQLHRITLDYRRECNHGDIVESLASLEGCDEEASSGVRTIGNGAATNGSARRSVVMDSEGNSVEFLHLLRMAGSEVEINRGRTVWKRKPEKRARQ